MSQHDLSTLLDKISKESFFDSFTIDNLLTREEWGNVIGIHRYTLGRWEKLIIENVKPIKTAYFGETRRMRANYLDAYQRFIIALIYVLKGGLDRRGKSHQHVIDFLKMNFTKLKREHFEQWRKDVNTRTVA